MHFVSLFSFCNSSFATCFSVRSWEYTSHPIAVVIIIVVVIVAIIFSDAIIAAVAIAIHIKSKLS